MAKTQPIDHYKPTPTQKRFHDALNGKGEFANVKQYIAGKDKDGNLIWWPGYKHVCLMGGIGSGKTWAAVAQGVHCSLEWPGNIGVVARKYARDLDTTTKKMYFRYLDMYGIDYKEYKDGRVIKIFTPFKIPSEIYFWGVDESERLGSNEIGWFHLEEASDLEDNGDAFHRLCDRLRFPWQLPELSSAAKKQKFIPRERDPYRRMGFVTANPPDEDHWLADYFPEPEMLTDGKHQLKDEHLLIQVNSYENKENLPAGYLESRDQNKSDSWRRVYIFGKYGFLKSGKPVYQGFSETLHVGELGWNRYLPVLRSWDFGRVHPCVLWGQIDQNGRWYILRELMGSDVLLQDFAKVIIARSQEWFPEATFKDCCDIAGTQRNDLSDKTSIQVLGEFGVNPLAKRVSRGIEEPDILRVQRAINTLIDGKPGLMVDKSCSIVIRALSGGYQVDKTGKYPEEDGFYEHPMDCLKYMGAHFLETASLKAAKDIEIQGPRWW